MQLHRLHVEKKINIVSMLYLKSCFQPLPSFFSLLLLSKGSTFWVAGQPSRMSIYIEL